MAPQHRRSSLAAHPRRCEWVYRQDAVASACGIRNDVHHALCVSERVITMPFAACRWTMTASRWCSGGHGVESVQLLTVALWQGSGTCVRSASRVSVSADGIETALSALSLYGKGNRILFPFLLATLPMGGQSQQLHPECYVSSSQIVPRRALDSLRPPDVFWEHCTSSLFPQNST